MKILILLFLITFNIEAQVSNDNIIFKAKLLTLSQHGVSDKEKLITDIDNKIYEIYEEFGFIFIKIKGYYFCEDLNYLYTVNWCDCNYYISYSKKKDIFYLLGGFKQNDIKEFNKEFQSYNNIYLENYNIDDEVLNKFLIFIYDKKIKKAKKCFENCIETL